MKLKSFLPVLTIAGSIAVPVAMFYHSNSNAQDKPAAAAIPATVNPPTVQADDKKGILRFPPNAPQLAYLKIEKVSLVPKPILQPLNGRITYNENFTSRLTSPLQGRVVKLEAQVGDDVKAGEPLLWLDSPDFISAIADVRKAEGDVKQKTLVRNRTKKLFDGEVLPRKDLEAAESDLSQSNIELERAKLRLKALNPAGNAKDHIEHFVLRAPITGIITERNVNFGTEVRPDAANPLFVITDPKNLWVLIQLEEKNLGKVANHQAVIVEVDAYPGETFAAQVSNIGTVLDTTTRRVQVRCNIDNKDLRLKPEMYARITPLTNNESEKVVKIPNSAILTEGLYNYAFVETSPGVLEKRKISLEMQGREFSFVKDGINNGERLVTTGAVLLNSELSSGK
ncbi:MAG: efflux RND transporter periplasmic adaptor subunit [Thiotrichaceae bacterium]|nr:efflux RND transporter periplasmic adaptor subunit [Thiotrichaceae bacterium]